MNRREGGEGGWNARKYLLKNFPAEHIDDGKNHGGHRPVVDPHGQEHRDQHYAEHEPIGKPDEASRQTDQ